MIKIDMTDKAKSEFKGNILGKLKALKKNSKLKSYINRLEKQLKEIKLSEFNNVITLESLITMDFNKLKIIKKYIDEKNITFDKDIDLYEEFINRKIRIEHIKNLNISVCPYCNRNYIVNFEMQSNQIISTAELDHFFPKSEYPCFAISIYNLVPCCHTCNHIKSNKNINIFSPLDTSINDKILFKYTPKNSDYLHSEEDFKLECDIFEQSGENEIKNTLELFHIINIYQKHKDLILELIQKSQIYTESYIDELLQNYQGKIFNNREDLLRLIIGVYVDEKDINKKPLSKLLIDISKSLGLLY